MQGRRGDEEGRESVQRNLLPLRTLCDSERREGGEGRRRRREGGEGGEGGEGERMRELRFQGDVGGRVFPGGEDHPQGRWRTHSQSHPLGEWTEGGYKREEGRGRREGVGEGDREGMGERGGEGGGKGVGERGGKGVEERGGKGVGERGGDASFSRMQSCLFCDSQTHFNFPIEAKVLDSGVGGRRQSHSPLPLQT